MPVAPIMATRSNALAFLRILLAMLCFGTLWFLKTQVHNFEVHMPSIVDLPSIDYLDLYQRGVGVTLKGNITADQQHSAQAPNNNNDNSSPQIHSSSSSSWSSCDNLDIERAQSMELQTGCSEQQLQSIDTSNSIVICNVKPVKQKGVTDANKNINNKNATILVLPQARGRLRLDWSYHPPLSRFATAIDAHQSNCSLPVATYHIDNQFGIGSHIALWSQAMCNSMEQKVRLRTYNPIWLWLDQTFCHATVAADKSPLLCYMPAAEFRCGCDEVPPNVNISDPRDKKHNQCSLLKNRGKDLLREFRAATTEFLFQRISPLVIREAERQVGLLFGPQGAPHDLITVHIRWGDKFWEMPNRTLVAVQGYMDAVSILLHETNGHNRTANIYLATEDPRAYLEFQAATPAGWNVFYDLTVEELNPFRPNKGNRASHMAKNSKGRAGLAGFASLLVAMEAKLFVLTTTSNWSRLMDHLRKNVINPRCNNCTKMIDLVSGVW